MSSTENVAILLGRDNNPSREKGHKKTALHLAERFFIGSKKILL